MCKFDRAHWMVCLIFLTLGTTHAAYADGPPTCQTADWDMTRELHAFGSAPRPAVGGSEASNTPILLVDALYALRLHEQGGIRFLQPPGHADMVSMPMGAMVHFAAPAGGLYRITVDSPLWIDVVTPSGIISPSAYHSWHECSVFRKSIDYILRADETVTLQLSGASTDLVKITVEPPLTPR